MKIKFLGAVEEVGRSAILVKTEEEGFLLDSGVALDHSIKFPVYVSPDEFNTLIISHCHLDHVGSAPLFFIGGIKKALMTKMTKELSRILLLDMLKVSKTYLPFETLEINRFIQYSTEIEKDKQYKINDNTFLEMKDAGHVLGASQILLKFKDKVMLYTGDMNVNKTRTVPPANTNYNENIDVLITESTYATTEHPPRDQVEKKFVEESRKIIEDGGTVLVPAFGVGRAQEKVPEVHANNFPYKVVLDGMAKRITEIFMNNPKELYDYKQFVNAVEKTYILQSDQERRYVTREPGIIVTPAGMLKGGPAVRYSEEIAKGRKNAIFLVSYQVEGTPGSTLLKKRVIAMGGKLVKVNAEVKQFDFSSHNGKNDYINLIKETNPKYVFFVHGSRENIEFLFNEINNNMKDTKAIMPKINENYEV
ncbi:MAG: MBL fold metallo-hydrolase [Candidatus Brockarchaeota archaeon]|nr:MBL fold metallo-hydrolase [Candidatus Brockarchaeota archaeon]